MKDKQDATRGRSALEGSSDAFSPYVARFRKPGIDDPSYCTVDCFCLQPPHTSSEISRGYIKLAAQSRR